MMVKISSFFVKFFANSREETEESIFVGFQLVLVIMMRIIRQQKLKKLVVASRNRSLKQMLAKKLEQVNIKNAIRKFSFQFKEIFSR